MRDSDRGGRLFSDRRISGTGYVNDLFRFDLACERLPVGEKGIAASIQIERTPHPREKEKNNGRRDWLLDSAAVLSENRVRFVRFLLREFFRVLFPQQIRAVLAGRPLQALCIYCIVGKNR